ncbi:MAG: accessory gene regulator B family protein [Clostridia bacterium]
MNYLSRCIADFYVARNIICEEEKDVYEYGTNLILSEALTFILIILISRVFFKVIDAVVFLLTFCLVRIHCGGFHADKVCVCRGTMIITFISTVGMSSLLESIELRTFITIMAIGLVIMLPVIPVKHPNKVLSKEQRDVNRAKGIITYVGFACLACVLWVSGAKQVGIIIGLSLGAVVALAIIGYFMNRRCKYEEHNKESIGNCCRLDAEGGDNSFR